MTRLRCGCVAASSAVTSPASTRCCTNESSLVRRVRSPSRSRYARESPTCARSSSVAVQEHAGERRRHAVEGVVVARQCADVPVGQAAGAAAARRRRAGAAGRRPTKRCTRTAEATSPAGPPPTPSATADGGCGDERRILVGRAVRPVSETTAASKLSEVSVRSIRGSTRRPSPRWRRGRWRESDREHPRADGQARSSPTAAAKASTMGHHDHGLNSPSSGSPSSMSAVRLSSGSSPPWALCTRPR